MAAKEKKIKCPSCSNEHDLNDYPGAFEIPCSCGYSILVPDVDAFLERDDGEETRFESRLPTSMDAEDEVNNIKMESAPEADLPFEVIPEDDDSEIKGSASLTPSENLPKEMAYDPFEVAGLDPENQDSLEDNNSSLDSQMAISPDQDSMDEASGLQMNPESSKLNSDPAIGSSSQLDSIILRNQLGSFGQLLGPDYRVVIQGLSRERKVELIHKTEDLLRERPWLDEEMRKRKIRLETLADVDEMSSIPEILAVELYLNVIELGGQAEVSLI